MPTAGRLAGAIVFALFGWYIAGITVPYFPESSAPTYWLPWTAGLGLFLGWKICGVPAGKGYNPAVGTGLTAAAALAFCMIFVLAFSQMITNALRVRYGGPMEAIVDIFQLMWEMAPMFYDWSLIGTLLVGGIVCSWITEYFGKRFP